MAATFLIGGRAYPVNEAGAAWLLERLRAWAHVDDLDHETWPPGADAIQLKRAQLVAEAITDDNDDPIELGIYDAQMLTNAIRTEHEVAGNGGLEALYDAARRLRGERQPAVDHE